MDWIGATMQPGGKIAPTDVQYLTVTDSPGEAVDIICDFYEKNCAERQVAPQAGPRRGLLHAYRAGQAT